MLLLALAMVLPQDLPNWRHEFVQRAVDYYSGKIENLT